MQLPADLLGAVIALGGYEWALPHIVAWMPPHPPDIHGQWTERVHLALSEATHGHEVGTHILCQVRIPIDNGLSWTVQLAIPRRTPVPPLLPT